MKIALITGVTGQDGSYLAELLLDKGYTVVGLVRRLSTPNFTNLHFAKKRANFHMLTGDLTDPASLRAAINKSACDEIYNLAAMSFVKTSWDQPVLTQNVNFIGVLHLLEAVKNADWPIKMYQASTSEMFGNVPPPQKETDAMIPHSPYGVAKLAAHRMCKVYRDSHDVHVSCGILFNHESPRRGIEFVTRKIANGVVKIKLGQQQYLEMGNVNTYRDWGYAKDYVRAMWLMLQQDDPDDYVIGTGISHSVQDFIKVAFESMGMEFDEIQHLVVDKKYYRPVDILELKANTAKANRVLGWKPSLSFRDLVRHMVEAEYSRLTQGQTLKK